MSPEQSGLLKTPIDHRSDLYSLGVTLYQLLAGRLPFEGTTASALVEQHVHAKETPLIELESTRLPVCEALSAIIGKMMAKEASQRYQSAFGAAADFERCLIGTACVRACAEMACVRTHCVCAYATALDEVKAGPIVWNNPEAPLDTAAALVPEDGLRDVSLPRDFSFSPLGVDDVVCILPVTPTR
jgi:serine/threonine protein kinase